MAKTILSPVTHARNFVSAGAFAVANGLAPGIGITPRMMKTAWKNLKLQLQVPDLNQNSIKNWQD